ncbi:MAG: S-methyl-5-thioribose-1-phosphate isomerase [Oscillospiraceae bacterium]|nr:S-methyl-5-thioribose-1-phosphate isomerase [Oscillospiraceae bacterium]
METNPLTSYELGANPGVRMTDGGEVVIILDQTQLPNREVRYILSEPGELFEAIAELQVRGAPAIGIFAAYALAVISAHIRAFTFDDFYNELAERAEYLNSARPTAVNLARATGRVLAAVRENSDLPVPELPLVIRREAYAIHREDIAMCRAISEYGLTLVKAGDGILTHCNAGPLATSRYGTGLGAILLAQERGIPLHAYVDETRPLLQGARLTAYELHNAGVDTTLICDSAASLVMRKGKINAVFVGCDRVARNGDVANKIGTSGAAILAKHYGIPFYVFCPSSTLDPECATGADIVIERRDPDEIRTKFFAEPIAPLGVRAYNPAFDVTDGELITAIVTEKGILRAPYSESLRVLYE